MKLIISPASPFARKARIVAIELGLSDQIEAVTLNALTETAQLAQSNPLGKIPALIEASGTCWFDSPVICERLQMLAGGDALIPAASEERLEQLQLQALADGIMDAAVSSAFESRRPDVAPSGFWLERWSAAIKRGLDLAEGMSTAWDGRFGIGQVSMICALGYLDLRMPDRDWRATRPGLKAFDAAHAARPSVLATAPV